MPIPPRLKRSRSFPVPLGTNDYEKLGHISHTVQYTTRHIRNSHMGGGKQTERLHNCTAFAHLRACEAHRIQSFACGFVTGPRRVFECELRIKTKKPACLPPLDKHAGFGNVVRRRYHTADRVPTLRPTRPESGSDIVHSRRPTPARDCRRSTRPRSGRTGTSISSLRPT